MTIRTEHHNLGVASQSAARPRDAVAQSRPSAVTTPRPAGQGMRGRRLGPVGFERLPAEHDCERFKCVGHLAHQIYCSVCGKMRSHDGPDEASWIDLTALGPPVCPLSVGATDEIAGRPAAVCTG